MLTSTEPQVYVVIEEYPFTMGFCIYKVFDNLNSAELFCKEKLEELPKEQKPEFDDWGLIEGINYRTITMELNK